MFTHPFVGLWQQKTHFCLPTKVRFLNDVCLRQMMTATPNDVRCANDVCQTAHWANIASLRNAVEQHHFERSEKHHCASAQHHCGVAATLLLMIYDFFRLDLSLKARYNKLIDNQEFVEKIATASCLSTPATRDII